MADAVPLRTHGFGSWARFFIRSANISERVKYFLPLHLLYHNGKDVIVDPLIGCAKVIQCIIDARSSVSC